MGTLERKEREKLEKKNTILKAATELFLKDGIDKLTVRNIAQKIEYSVGTIYLYYKDKDELFHALMGNGLQKLVKEIQKIPAYDDHLAYMKDLARTYISFGLKNPEYYDLMFIKESPETPAEVPQWEMGTKAFDALYNSIEIAVDRKLIKFTDAPTASLIIWGIQHGLVALHNRNRLTMYDKETLEKQLHTAMDGFIDSIKV